MNRSLLTMSFLLVGMMLTAAPITKGEAQQKALQFLTARQGDEALARGMQQVKLQLKEGVATDLLYVFNVGQREGFVIVSGDDCTGDAILGYADSGEITAENMPTNLKAWLQGYADEIQWMQEHGVRSKSVAASRGTMRRAKSAVSAMLTTKWNQSTPYNTYCPDMNAEGTVKAVTGCVATAAAQVMYYQAAKHDISSTTTTAIPTYNSTTYYWYFNGEQYTAMPAKPARTIDWTKIDAGLTTDDARDEVARLMEYIGASVEMQYGAASTGGSAANSAKVGPALNNYFGYDPDVKLISHDDYTDEEWEDAIYTELSTNGPVFFGGASSTGGHAFVVEGYDSSDEMFYINWGWGGLSDGKFKLTLLNPQDQGAGGSGAGYNSDQEALINVSAVNDGVNLNDEACLTVNEWSCTISTYGQYSSYYGELRDYTVYPPQINFNLANESGWDLDFEWGVAIYQNNSLVNVVYGPMSQSLSNKSYSYGITGSFNWGNSLAAGEYQLVAVSRKVGTSTWRKCIGSDKYYVRMVVGSPTTALTNYPAIEFYNADGTQQVIEITASVTVPSDALAIDLSQADGVTSVTPNSNPNTLYFVGSSVPSGLDGKNVVQDGTAATLTLTDGYGFYAPKQFTATEATYTRRFTTAASGTGGWSTIVLPFNVSTVKQGSTVIDWFHSGSDTGKNFWLKEFSSDGSSTVNFSYATQMAANTPYIIAVPGDTWGAKWDLTNKDITFEGSSVQVLPSTDVATTKSNYSFAGTLPGESVTNCYVLNATGTAFVNTTATVDPFRAYFKALGLGSPGSLTIGSEANGTSGISLIPCLIPNGEGGCYNLNGQRVANPTKGLYIVEGKKVIIK